MTDRIEFEGVEGLRVGRFGGSITSTCIVYRIGRTAIDTGPPNQWHRVRQFLHERNTDTVLITHHHEDHSGNGARLQRDLTATVFMPSNGVDLVRNGFPLRLYQRVVWGTPNTFTPKAVPDELALSDGYRLRPIASPGHSPDMTCYLAVDRGWLFTGDAYIASQPKFFRADENVVQQIETLHALLEHEFDTVFCAHRGVVRKGRDALRQKADYLTTLREEVRRRHDRGESVTAITRHVLGREPIMSALTGFHFSKRNLIRACLPQTESTRTCTSP